MFKFPNVYENFYFEKQAETDQFSFSIYIKYIYNWYVFYKNITLAKQHLNIYTKLTKIKKNQN